MNVKMTTIDNNNLTSSTSIDMKDSTINENNVTNENDLPKMNDNNQALSIENNNNVNMHFEIRSEASPNGQIAYKVLPIVQNEVIVTNFSNSNQNHILTNGSSDSESKISVLSNLDTMPSLYLMMQTPELVSANHKLIAKATPQTKIYSNNSSTKTVRDERRRANHNEVERRRRDNINKWIVELSKVIPDCSNDHTKHGQSKGGILEKTVQYLIDTKIENDKLRESLKNFDKIKIENEKLREENEHFRRENNLLRIELDKKCSSTTN